LVIAIAAVQDPGELVWARLFNGLEDPAARGKTRPVILLRKVESHWLTMGLTTNRRYRDGSLRIPIPNPAAVGLSGPGYLWGDRLARISTIDLGDHIGWVDRALAKAIIRLTALPEEDAAALLEASHGQ
jgi:hypothetical protein